MTISLPRRADIAAMLRLAIPVVVVQVGMMLLGVVDTMVVGRLTSQALAAVALGHVVIVGVSSFGIGMLLALDPLVSQAVGGGDPAAVRRSVQRGLLLQNGDSARRSPPSSTGASKRAPPC